jgi:predicted  nucleic acid-binding Zn-ribbon protein
MISIIILVVTIAVICLLSFFVIRFKSNLKKTKLEVAERTSALEKEISEKESKIQDLKNGIQQIEANLKENTQKLEVSEKTLSLLNKNDEAEAIKESIQTAEKYKNELVKLKKQLDEAEDDLDEAQDEAKSYKKKWESQKTNLEDISQHLDKCKKELSQLQTSFDEKCQILSETTEKLSTKKESLDFVNEILQAKDSDSKDIKELNTKIAAIVNVVKNNICDNIEEFKNQKQEIEKELWQWENLQHKTWLQKNKVIAFVGEFSAGKTSIVNRILSQDNDNAPKLPVSSKATTAIPTYISYGREFFSQYTTPEGKLKNIHKETFEKVNKEILEQINVSPLIQYFVMSYNNQNLQNLSVLDTPGFNSNDKEDARRTADVIREADALFWVFDANSGEINKSSIATISDNLKGVPLFIVINKADTKSPNELNSLEEHIKQTVAKNNIPVNGYIRFSQKESLDKLKQAVQSIPHDNSKNDFLPKIYYKLNSLNKKADSAFKEAKKDLDKKTKKEEDCVEKMNERCKDIYDKCKDISEMPEEKKEVANIRGRPLRYDTRTI